MPAKKQDKKGGQQQQEEDLSDLSSLPHLNIVTMSTLYYFYFQKSRDEVKETIDSMLSEEQVANLEGLTHVKTITRESIIEALQAKAEAVEGEEPKEIDSKAIAQGFTEKIVELGLPLRREKKQSSGQDEAKEDEGQDQPKSELTKTDMMINLVNFPLNQEEFVEFTKLRNPLNKLVVVREKKPQDFDELLKESHKEKPQEGEGEGDKEPAPEGEGDEPPKLIENEERDVVDKLTRSYDYKAFKSPKDSIHKLSDLKVFHYEHIVEGAEEGAGEGSQPPKNTLNELKERFSTELISSEKKFIEFYNKVLSNKVEPSRPATAQSKKSEVSQKSEKSQSEQSQKEVVKQELVPAGFQENIMSQAVLQEEEFYGSTEDLSGLSKWDDFDIYSKNTTRVEYDKTSVAHLLISAIKQVSHKQQKVNDLERKNQDVSDLQAMLKQGFEFSEHLDEDNTEEIQVEETGNINSKSLHQNDHQEIQQEEQDQDGSKENRGGFSQEVEDTKPKVKVVAGLKSPLFDQVDQIVLQNHLMMCLDGTSLEDIERGILNSLVLPGTRREGMPESPELSLPKRKADINEIVSFSTIGSEKIQRALWMKEIADLMKDKEPEREWEFYDRNYWKALSKDAVKYEISRYLLLNPNIATKYSSREDGLFVSLYFKNPPGRIMRNQWSYNFATSTEFRDFLSKYDGDSTDFTDLGGSDDLKYFNKKSSIKCNEKTMYPSDNSVIKTIKCEIGNKTIGRSLVIKDNYTFGMREAKNSFLQNEEYLTREERQQKQNNINEENLGGELWCTLGDPSVQFFVENVIDDRDEGDSKENSGAAATFSYQDGLIVKFLPSMEVLQSRIDSQRTYKQKTVDLPYNHTNESEIELKRLITKHGTVLRYMKDKSIQLLFSNGNYSVYSPKDKVWTKINNSGEKSMHYIDNETGKVSKIVKCEPLTVEENIDPETNQLVLIRSDGVMIINYNDGTTLTLHHDNTKILTKPDDENFEKFIEKDDYAPVRIRFNAVKLRAHTIIGMGGTNALMGIDNLMERSNDGFVLDTYLPDDALVETYKEKQQLEGYNNFSLNTIHLIRRHDYSVIKVKQEGEVVIITSNQRFYLNDIGYRCDIGEDKDYFFELYGFESDRRSGVFTCDVSNGTIRVTDEESNIFVVYANGESIEKLSVSFNLNETADSFARKKPNSPRNLPDGEYIDEECKFLVPPNSVMDPRLFFIKNNEEGYEFFNIKQLEYFLRARDVDTKSLNENKQITIGTEKVNLITSLSTLKKRTQRKMISDIAEIPQNVSAAVQTILISSNPEEKVFINSKLLEFDEIDAMDIKNFEDSMERYQAHKKMQADEAKRLEVIEEQLDFRSKAKLKEEQEFFEKVLKLRNQ
ncbi:unnamed protein product [Moneuplotes crassus]|uniref:Uncharacterized protein n=1 Tax=Euplotes crassus TaxID=5936 RepID=A0AAD1X849_EUPCR|nr:unnamed protein product [Moneuplotes crassus]